MGKNTFFASTGRQKTKPVRRLFLVAGMVSAWTLSGFAVDPARASAGDSRLQSIVVDGYFDPARNFLDATARLRFAQPADEQRLWLAEELLLSSVRSGSMPAMNFKRDSGQLLVQSAGQDELELSYSGRLVRSQDPIEAAWGQGIPDTKTPPDDCCFLSYSKDFYPQPLLDFTPIKMNIRIPSGWSCLGNGTLQAVRPQSAGSTYMFDNTAGKGMALVCGHFNQVGLVAGVIPIRLHAWPGFNFKSYFTETEMAQVLSFYNGQFGALQVPALNVLFRNGRYFSGISYNGLIVLTIDESWPRLPLLARKKIQKESLVTMIDARTDLLAHELAHQWWGGLLSWKTISDNWITEGLATYSTMLYLRERQGENAYRDILKRLYQRVKRYAKAGVPAAGFKLKLLNRDLKVYQALVYLKPVLMLAELADTIGCSELCLRLRAILKDRRGSNLDTAEFLRLLGGGDEGLQERLKEWICSKGMPEDPPSPKKV